MFIMLAMPIVQIIIFGYAITTEIKEVSITVLDYSRDDLTQKISDRLEASEYFTLYKQAGTYDEIQTLFKQGKIRLAIIFPPQFSSSPDAEVQVLADATDPNEATQLTSYATAIINTQVAQNRRGVSDMNSSPASASIITPVVQLLYNPQMKGSYNFVPGVMGMILIMICALMTSVGIVREKELGTMEILLVSPLKPIYIILAKAIPYLIFSMVNITTILCLSYFLLEVPIAGNLLLLLTVSMLYALLSLCLGLLISTIADTQQAAMLISAMLLMLPVILLSGMVFPVENMPVILQWLSNIVPAKWYIMAVKDIMIKGVPLSGVLKEIGIMSIMALFILIVSVKRFNVRLS